MDDLVKKVIVKLLEREHSILTYDYGNQNSYSTKNFLDNQTIRMTGMNALVLQKLVNLEEHQFVSWVLDGIHYGIDFHFHVSSATYHLIPLELLIKWPIRMYNEKNQRIVACPEKAITYKEMISLPDAAILIRTKSQIITDLAKEVEEKKHIKVIERF